MDATDEIISDDEWLLRHIPGGTWWQAPGPRITRVRSGAVRGLGLRVVAKPLDHDQGHAEIQSDQASLDDHACRKKLALLFEFIDEAAPSAGDG